MPKFIWTFLSVLLLPTVYLVTFCQEDEFTWVGFMISIALGIILPIIAINLNLQTRSLLGFKEEYSLREIGENTSVVTNILQISAFILTVVLLFQSKVIKNHILEKEIKISGQVFESILRKEYPIPKGDDLNLIVKFFVNDTDSKPSNIVSIMAYDGMIDERVRLNSNVNFYSYSLRDTLRSKYKLSDVSVGVQSIDPGFYITPIVESKKDTIDARDTAVVYTIALSPKG